MKRKPNREATGYGFNTTNVSVEYNFYLFDLKKHNRFNTTNVSVEYIHLLKIYIYYKRFNTTNVSVEC